MAEIWPGGTNVGIKNSNRGGLTSAGGTNVGKYLGQMIGTCIVSNQLVTDWFANDVKEHTIFRLQMTFIWIAKDVYLDCKGRVFGLQRTCFWIAKVGSIRSNQPLIKKT